MIIDFFETDHGLDRRAVAGGIYQVQLVKKQTGQAVLLYIGESVWIAERCGRHLYAFFEDPRYFGLKPEQLEQDEWILKFSILEEIKGKKSLLGVGRYKEAEMAYIRRENPVTQLSTSDKQIGNIDEKVKRVQDALGQLNFEKG